MPKDHGRQLTAATLTQGGVQLTAPAPGTVRATLVGAGGGADPPAHHPCPAGTSSLSGAQMKVFDVALQAVLARDGQFRMPILSGGRSGPALVMPCGPGCQTWVVCSRSMTILPSVCPDSTDLRACGASSKG